MQQITVKTFRAGLEIDKPHFFILNKGKNSGHPAKQPWANCYVAFGDDADVVEYYYWLCYMLWQTKAFEYYLRGSCVEFIDINDVKTCLRKYFIEFAEKQIAFQKILNTLKAMDDYETLVTNNLNNIKKVRKHLLQSYLKGK